MGSVLWNEHRLWSSDVFSGGGDFLVVSDREPGDIDCLGSDVRVPPTVHGCTNTTGSWRGTARFLLSVVRAQLPIPLRDRRLMSRGRDYSFNVPQPNRPVFPSQCLSMATPGQTITYESLTTGTNGAIVKRTTSVVNSAEVTIWAVPVNGYNFPASSTSVSNAGATIFPTATATSKIPGPTTTEQVRGATGRSNQSSGPPLSTTVGVSVGAVIAVLVLVGGIFMWWRRRGRSRTVNELEGQSYVKPPSSYGRKFELAAEVIPEHKHELSSDGIHIQRTIHELPANREKG